jgi:hypothetical protein
MTEYMVKPVNAKDFCMTQNDKIVGELKYKNRFYVKAQIFMADSKIYALEPKGFFGNTVELRDRHRVLLSFRENWRGRIVIGVMFENFNRTFIFKHRGILKAGYVLTNADDNELATIMPQFKLKKFNYDYTITAHEAMDHFGYKEVLLLTCIHCANYLRRRDSTVAGG